MEKPLDPIDAFETIQRLLADGTDAISFPRHAQERAEERQFTHRDVQRVLTTGPLVPIRSGMTASRTGGIE